MNEHELLFATLNMYMYMLTLTTKLSCFQKVQTRENIFPGREQLLLLMLLLVLAF